jgi:hypothetical protein
MKTQVTIEGARLFGVKSLGGGCRFGVRVNSKKQDGTYTKGTFLNCKHKEVLSEGQNYTLSGFLADNEYQDKNTLELIVMTAVAEGIPAKSNGYVPDDSDSTIPF